MTTALTLPDGIGKLVVRLMHGASAPLYRPPRPLRLTRGDADIAETVSRIEVEGSRLVAEQVSLGTDANMLSSLVGTDSEWGVKVDGVLQDGTDICAGHSFVTRTNLSQRSDQGYLTRRRLELWDWEILPKVHTRVYWLTPITIPNGFTAGAGNLKVNYRRGTMGSGSHIGFFRLDGRYGYHLFRNGDGQWYLLMDDAPALERIALRRELLVLSYCLGGWVGVSALTALDETGVPIGMYGVGTVSDSETRHAMSPVDVKLTPWLATLFSKTVRAVDETHAEGLNAPIWRYLLSLAPVPLESQYGEVMTGIEEMTETVLTCHDITERPDSSAGRLREIGRKLLADGTVRSLLGLVAGDELESVLSRLVQPTTRMRLESALTAIGLTVPGALLDEIDAYQFGRVRTPGSTENADPSANGERFWKRVCAMRQLLVALIAKQVGYGGPLADDSPGWWTISEEEGSIPRYVLDVRVDEMDMLDWPPFEPPRLPMTPLVAELALFAAKLEQRTNGDVAATLRPLPSAEGGAARMEFRLILRDQPATQVILFSVVDRGHEIEVQGWGEAPFEIGDATAMGRFCQELAKSADVQQRVNEMQILAGEIRRFRYDKTS